MAIVSELRKEAADRKAGMTFEELAGAMADAELFNVRNIKKVEINWSGKIKAITFTNVAYYPETELPYTPTTRRIIGKDPENAD